MTLDAGLGIALAVAFVAGVVSFASPCCLPLVPAYIGYMVGATGELDRRRSTLHGVAFVVGFTLVFVAVWASIGLIGYVLADSMQYLRVLGGVVLMVLGLQVAGVINLRALWRDTRPMPAFGGAGGGSFSGVAPSPSADPDRARRQGSARLRALARLRRRVRRRVEPLHRPDPGRDHRPGHDHGQRGLRDRLPPCLRGRPRRAVLAVAMGATWVAHRLGWVGRHHRAVSLVSGTMLVVLGFLVATNLLARLAALCRGFGVADEARR